MHLLLFLPAATATLTAGVCALVNHAGRRPGAKTPFRPILVHDNVSAANTNRGFYRPALHLVCREDMR